MAKNDFIYGRRPVIEHLENGGRFEQIMLQKGIDRDVIDQIRHLGKKLDVPVQVTHPQRLNRVTRKNHQGVIAFTAWVEYRDIIHEVQDCYERGEVPLVIALDRITDVRNVGAIARSAEVFGATALLMPVKESARLNSDAVKTSAGAILKVPICKVKSLKSSLRELHQMGLQIHVADQSGKQYVEQADMKVPMVLVMGSEGEGVDMSILAMADAVYSIPQVGETDSLNVSVATGIVLYEVVRQRKQSE